MVLDDYLFFSCLCISKGSGAAFRATGIRSLRKSWVFERAEGRSFADVVQLYSTSGMFICYVDILRFVTPFARGRKRTMPFC